MMIAIMLATVLVVPVNDCVLRDQVDVIEINHFCDARGSLVFDQWIAWRWYSSESAYRVVAWRIMRGVRVTPPKQVEPEPDGWTPRPGWKGGHATPLKRHDRGGMWVSAWYDEQDQVRREVAAPMYRETWTQYDPELHDREWLPPDRRAGLRRPKSKRARAGDER